MYDNVPIFESPFFESELSQGIFTDEEKDMLRRFNRDGYLIISTDFSEDQLDAVVADLQPEFDTLTKNGGDGRRIVDAWKKHESVRTLAINKEIQKTLKLLFQRTPIPFQTLNFPVGTQQKTHSDMIHFNSIPQRFMCGVWVALEDITDDNGPLHYYPGSHKLPFYDMIDMGVKGSKNTNYKKEMMSYAKDYEVFIERLVATIGIKKEKLNIKKGQAIIWSANLLHGGEKINDPNSTRHSQVTHYFFNDCIYYTPYLSDIAINKLYIRNITDINTGKKVPNKYFDKKVNPGIERAIKNDVISMLSKVSHLFPKSFVEKTKKIISK